jgi:hypothetical protein
LKERLKGPPLPWIFPGPVSPGRALGETLPSPIFVTRNTSIPNYKYWTEAAGRKLFGSGFRGKRSGKDIFGIPEYFS